MLGIYNANLANNSICIMMILFTFYFEVYVIFLPFFMILKIFSPGFCEIILNTEQIQNP